MCLPAAYDDGGNIVGWIAFDRCRDADKAPHTGEVWAIYVLPEVIGQGVGRELWLRALGELQHLGFTEATLWVLAKNQRARQFYGKAGFRPEPESAKHVDIGGIKLEELRYARTLAV
jgi:ribosomal protein S18 acetylase RimI-like enzyme